MDKSNSYELVRWGIPGWVAILSFIVFVSADIIGTPQQSTYHIYSSLTDFFKVLGDNSALITGLIITGAGIPLGYLIYQLYFYVRWNSPFSIDGLLPPLIVGRQQDIDRTLEGFTLEDLVGDNEWKKKIISTDNNRKIDHAIKWRFLENNLNEAFQIMDQESDGLKLVDRHRHIMDIMHALGSTAASIYIGFIGYIILKVKTEPGINLLPSLLVAVILLISLIFIVNCEDKAKHDAIKSGWHNIFQFNRMSLLFIYFLFVIFLSIHPLLNGGQHFSIMLSVILPIILTAIPFIFLLSDKGENKIRPMLTIIIFLLLVVILFGILLLTSLVNTWDWAFVFPLLIFLTLNLFLLKNRQNTRDDLIEFERYILSNHIAMIKAKKNLSFE